MSIASMDIYIVELWRQKSLVEYSKHNKPCLGMLTNWKVSQYNIHYEMIPCFVPYDSSVLCLEKTKSCWFITHDSLSLIFHLMLFLTDVEHETKIQCSQKLTKCPQPSFLCKTESICIGIRNVCDGVSDCIDGTDEENCEENTQTFCDLSKMSLNHKLLCDFTFDCQDKSDEKFCSTFKISLYCY